MPPLFATVIFRLSFDFIVKSLKDSSGSFTSCSARFERIYVVNYCHQMSILVEPCQIPMASPFHSRVSSYLFQKGFVGRIIICFSLDILTTEVGFTTKTLKSFILIYSIYDLAFALIFCKTLAKYQLKEKRLSCLAFLSNITNGSFFHFPLSASGPAL